jgi:polar amino acid transport system substrate-binding protein
MKRVFIICLLFYLLNASIAISGDKPLLISGMVNYPPVMWEENGKYVGIAEELAAIIFKKLNISYEYRILPWKRAQEKAKSGAIDLITGIYWNAERDKFLSYSTPFMSAPGVLFVRHGYKFSYTQWSDLIGKTGILNQGYSWGEGFDRFAKENLDIVWVNEPFQGFQMLNRQDRKVDYYLYGLLPGIIVINRHNLQQQIDYIPTHVTDEKFYIAFSKKSPHAALLPEVNTVIDRLVEEKFVDYLFTKYINYYQNYHSQEKAGDK